MMSTFQAATKASIPKEAEEIRYKIISLVFSKAKAGDAYAMAIVEEAMESLRA